MLRKILVIGSAFLILSWHTPQESQACSCLPPPPPAEAVAAADAVFLAKVIAFEEMPAQYERLARLQMERIWKGRPEEADSVYTALNSAACGYDFQLGGTYLIYANRREPGRLWTHLCSRTAHVADAADDLKFLASFSQFPLAVDNSWKFMGDKTESIVDTLRLDGQLYFRFDHFREFNGALLRRSEDGKLFVRYDTLEQVWVDFNADFKESWHVKGPLNLGDEWDVQLESRMDTVRTPAGTFFPCQRFHFRFAGADYDWDEWYFPNIGVVKRTLYGIAIFHFPLESANINGKNFPNSVEEKPPAAPPQIFELAQNYPNPFAAAVTANTEAVTFIHYFLQQSAEVNLTIFDATGRAVKTLVDGFQIAGEYRASWDGRDQGGEHVSGGIYFYKLAAGKYAQVKKLTLFR
ncbi:MAG: FlgD immunoglobulin-like domain containing protein [bacterium]